MLAFTLRALFTAGATVQPSAMRLWFEHTPLEAFKLNLTRCYGNHVRPVAKVCLV